MENTKNIRLVRTDCCSCGACSVVCPTNCIDFYFDNKLGHYQVRVDEEKCVNCSICIKECPVYNSGRKNVNPINAYAGYSKDPNIRRYAASGGFVTSFLIFMLENKIIDGVLLSRRKGIEGQSYIATTIKEIIDSKTSIYAPVDYTNGLKELKDTSLHRVAVVGLPCQIQAVSNWMEINKKIADIIFIKIAIVCGKTPSTNAYRYIAKKAGFKFDGIKNVCNRGDGWPGYMTIQHQSGEFRTSYRSKLSMGSVLSSPFLCNRGCLSCIDGLGKSADISVSDAWLPKYTLKSDDGWNLILTMTEKAEELMKSGDIKSYLHLDEETIDHFFHANNRVINKASVGNMMRNKENRNNKISASLSIKKRIYVMALRATLKIFKPSRMNCFVLFTGKVINKLKG